LFIEALFTIAKNWIQPKCPSTDEWIRKYGITHINIYICIYRYMYIYKMKYISSIRNNEIRSFAGKCIG
jgi:hypothetical protein